MLHSLSLTDDGEGLLRIAGELDAASAPEFERRLRVDRSIHSLDLASVSFIDCSALRSLLDANHSRSGALALRNPSPAVRRLLRLTEVEQVFHILDTEL